MKTIEELVAEAMALHTEIQGNERADIYINSSGPLRWQAAIGRFEVMSSTLGDALELLVSALRSAPASTAATLPVPWPEEDAEAIRRGEKIAAGFAR